MSNEKYGIQLRSLNRYNTGSKTYNYGKVYMVSLADRGTLLHDPNGNYFEDVLVTAEEYIFVNDGPHVLALRNGLPGTQLVAPPAVVVPEVVDPPAGTEVANIEPPAPPRGKLSLKTPAKPVPRDIVAGEASLGLPDSGAGLTVGPDMSVSADISDDGVGVEV